MVDINLFDEDEAQSGKRGKEWDSPPSKQENQKSEPFKDELSLDDDLGGTSSLGADTLLGDEEVVPELEGPGEVEPESGYKKGGEKKKKKTPAYQYVILIGLVIALVAYLYFNVFSKGGNQFTSFKRTKTPSISYQTPTQQQPGSLAGKEPTGIGRTGAGLDSGKVQPYIYGQTVNLIDVARTIYTDLSGQEQFGAVLLDGDRFYVEYVSVLPGVSPQVGKRLQTLLGVRDTRASPEDRHILDGKNTYWGVVSGVLPKKPVQAAGTAKSVDQFIEQIKTTAKQNSLSSVEVKRLSEEIPSTGRETNLRIRIQGTRSQVIAWMEQLKKAQPECGIKTLFLVSTDYFNQKAAEVKLILDVAVTAG